LLPDETLETLVFLRKVALASASSPGIGSNTPFNSLPGCSPTPQPSSGAPLPLVPLGAQRIVSGGANATALPSPTFRAWVEVGVPFPISSYCIGIWKCHLGLANVFSLTDL